MLLSAENFHVKFNGALEICVQCFDSALEIRVQCFLDELISRGKHISAETLFQPKRLFLMDSVKN
jgi:hypothetical protein